jgi:hypothetical protein
MTWQQQSDDGSKVYKASKNNTRFRPQHSKIRSADFTFVYEVPIYKTVMPFNFTSKDKTKSVSYVIEMLSIGIQGWAQPTWGDLFHTAKNRSREVHSSVMCSLVVIKTPTKECKSSQTTILEGLLFINNRNVYILRHKDQPITELP